MLPDSKDVTQHKVSELYFLSFDTFDLDFILEHGTHLLGSSGLLYLEEDELQHLSPRERLKKQRENLTKQLYSDMEFDKDNHPEHNIKLEDLVT